MAYRVSLTAQALRDIGAAHDWYSKQAPGLGEEFLAAAGLQIERLRQAPQLYAEVLPRVRRCLLPRFPYGLFFTLRGDDIRVLAVLHQTRDHHSRPVGRKGSGQ